MGDLILGLLIVALAVGFLTLPLISRHQAAKRRWTEQGGQ